MSAPDDVVCERARGSLTTKQYEVWYLHSYGLSARAIAMAFGLSRATVRETLHGAFRKLDRLGVRCDGDGRWYIKEERDGDA